MAAAVPGRSLIRAASSAAAGAVCCVVAWLAITDLLFGAGVYSHFAFAQSAGIGSASGGLLGVAYFWRPCAPFKFALLASWADLLVLVAWMAFLAWRHHATATDNAAWIRPLVAAAALAIASGILTALLIVRLHPIATDAAIESAPPISGALG
ncbi:MAG: hypothetical protein KGJ62_06030 [Armatimonadetes bacterium]|nr:hypothetical protein [Armatimonadota bacterium]MDE2205928.1 hypothetical protein [Armatimonadota bacterium]